MQQEGAPSLSPYHGSHLSSQRPVVGPRSPLQLFGRSPATHTHKETETERGAGSGWACAGARH